jgi:hypothetical protein
MIIQSLKVMSESRLMPTIKCPGGERVHSEAEASYGRGALRQDLSTRACGSHW